MRHRNTRSRLGRTTEHRLALMKALANALVREERIRTTKAKAMQLRGYVEPLVTLARRGDLAARRLVFSRLGQKETTHKLFEEIGPRVGQRPGGYLRVVKDGPRMGDGADMAYIEFVDRASEVAGGDAAGATSSARTLKQRLHERRKEMARARR